MPVNGKAKGSVAEREVAALLEEWWSKAEPGCRFVRVPMSGGWHGPAVRKEFRASGDVMTTALSFPWSVECKRRESWSLENVIRGRRSPVWGWWAQACAQAEESGLEPMLWFRKNRCPWKVMVDCGWSRAWYSNTLFAEAFAGGCATPELHVQPIKVGDYYERLSRPVVIDGAWILGQDPARYRRTG